MMDTTVEGSSRVIQCNHALKVDGEIGLLREVDSIDGMNVVSTIGATYWSIGALIDISLRCQIPCVGVGVDYTCGCHSNSWVDVDATIEIGDKKRSV
jgi:hypothetical protein